MSLTSRRRECGHERAGRDRGMPPISLTAERPGIYQQALSMARMLDNPDLQGIWPRCSRDLCKLLEDLRPKTSKRKTQRSTVVRLRT